MRVRIRSRTRAAAITLVAALLLPASASAEAPKEPEFPRTNPMAAAFDLVIVRPLELIGLAVGTGAFVPVAVITAPNGLDSVETALKVFVTEPAKNVFQRPLGDL